MQTVDGSTILCWVHTVPPGNAVTYYAFTFPYSYTELQNYLHSLDQRLCNRSIVVGDDDVISEVESEDSYKISDPEEKKKSDKSRIYYARELVVHSLDSHRLDMLTITSYTGKTNTREDRLPGLFPDSAVSRPHKFIDKKVIFISARVHPGETPASFVFRGFVDFILSDDPRACRVRDLYVFKLVPMLNPDGVIRGHYRSDQRGVNLNRVYIEPSLEFHPTIYAARSLLMYYHNGHIESARSVVPQPTMLDEDTCHSFSEAATYQEAKNLGRSAASMEMDEPSASGWDTSSNISFDSSIHSSSLIRAPDMADIHDDCSNISGVSETTETGVTSLFGALAASDAMHSPANSFFSKLDAPVTRAIKTNVSQTPSHVSCNKCQVVMKKPSLHECGRATRSITKQNTASSSNNNLLKHSLLQHQTTNLFSESNIRLHTQATPSIGTSYNKSPSFLTPLISSPSSRNPPNFTLSTHHHHEAAPHYALQPTIGIEHQRKSTVTSSPCLSSSSTSATLVPSITAGGGGGGTAVGVSIGSSSESEAEVGLPGREGVTPLTSGTGTINSSQITATPSDEEGKNLHMYVDLHGHASKRGKLRGLVLLREGLIQYLY